jgi:hypothetical protein
MLLGMLAMHAAMSRADGIINRAFVGLSNAAIGIQCTPAVFVRSDLLKRS